MRIANTVLTCIIYSVLEMKIIGLRHMEKLLCENIRLTHSALAAPFRISVAIGEDTAYETDPIFVHYLRLKTSGGLAEFR